jgi:hypothetical protein
VDDKKTSGIPTAGYRARTAEYQGQDEGKMLCRMTAGRKAAEYLRRRLQNNAQEDRKKYRIGGLENIGQDTLNLWKGVAEYWTTG